MHRLGVYRIRLQKKKNTNPPDLGAYGGREKKGIFVPVTRFVSRTLINQTYVCQRTYIGRTTLKESVNHPLTGKPS